jgi:uncharacterized 2Fe-2S/4Fe-4S cluster protein (DUF4445 family)
MSMFKVIFLSANKTADMPAGTTLLEAAVAAGVEVEAACGGKGTCGKCKVRIIKGGVSHTTGENKLLSAAEMADGWVLACQQVVDRDLVVNVESRQDAASRKLNLYSPEQGAEPEPAVEKTVVMLSRPTVADSRSDFERLLDFLPGLDRKPSLSLLQSLPGILRHEDFRVTVVARGSELLAVEPGDTSGRIFGAAFDIGTTTLVGSLLDLQSGRVLATEAGTNPQKVFGADVISRITHAASSPEKLKQLQQYCIDELNDILSRLFKKAKVTKNEVYEAVAVGNTTMSHLFLGVDPTHLAPAPFVPAFSSEVDVSAAELGLNINPAGRVLVLPNIAGYVGSDTVAVMLACRLDEGQDIRLAIDIGTNGEVVLAGRGRILTCSTAAGPAFEGAQIKCGMRAADGAIETVAIEDGEVKLQVIGSVAPSGICGSGLLDAASAMLMAGVLNERGQIVNPDLSDTKLDAGLKERLHRTSQGTDFLLTAGSDGGEDIVLAQKDIRELQLAKGAIHAGIKVLMREMGISVEDITEVLLAGAFGNFISKESALAIGLLPPVPLDKVISVGNAAGEGAKLALISKKERARALALAKAAEHVELSARADFQEEFISSLFFPAVKES